MAKPDTLKTCVCNVHIPDFSMLPSQQSTALQEAWLHEAPAEVPYLPCLPPPWARVWQLHPSGYLGVCVCTCMRVHPCMCATSTPLCRFCRERGVEDKDGNVGRIQILQELKGVRLLCLSHSTVHNSLQHFDEL